MRQADCHPAQRFGNHHRQDEVTRHRGIDNIWSRSRASQTGSRNRIRGERYVGVTVRAVKGLGDIPPVPAVINFHEPGDIFEEAILEQAMTTDRAYAAVYAHIDFGEEVRLDESGDRLDGQMVHMVRYRSGRIRFILGLDADANHPVPDTVGLGLLQHCYTEFGYLAKVLPSLCWADRVNRADVPVCGSGG